MEHILRQSMSKSMSKLKLFFFQSDLVARVYSYGSWLNTCQKFPRWTISTNNLRLQLIRQVCMNRVKKMNGLLGLMFHVLGVCYKYWRTETNFDRFSFYELTKIYHFIQVCQMLTKQLESVNWFWRKRLINFSSRCKVRNCFMQLMILVGAIIYSAMTVHSFQLLTFRYARRITLLNFNTKNWLRKN